MKLYALERCTNDYNCGFELQALWKTKPSIETLATRMGIDITTAKDEVIVLVVEVWKMQEDVKFPTKDHDDYHLITVETAD